MPIRGLTDREEAFPVIGRIRKGSKKQKKSRRDGSEYEIWGQELTYFRFDFVEGEEETAAVIENLYGKQPNGIRVLFPFDEIDRIWSAWKVAFTAGTLLGRSDGQFVMYLQDNKGNVIVREWVHVETRERYPHPANDIAGSDFHGKAVKFENSGVLKVMLYDMPRAAYLELVTGSDYDIMNIDSQLKGFKVLNGGKLAGIPFILRRVPRMISTPGDSKDSPRVRRKKYLVNIEVDPEWMARMFGHLRSLALPPSVGEDLPSLPAGTTLETEFDRDEVIDEDPEEEPAAVISTLTETQKLEQVYCSEPYGNALPSKKPLVKGLFLPFQQDAATSPRSDGESCPRGADPVATIRSEPYPAPQIQHFPSIL